MGTATTLTGISPEEFLQMDDPGYELCDGALEERNVSMLSSRTEAHLVRKVLEHVEANELGEVFSSSLGLQIFPLRPRRIPRADLVFISDERLAQVNLEKDGFLTVAPELVAEIVSRHDSATNLEGKIEDYLSAGVSLIWVIYPELRSARVHRADGSSSLVAPGGSLDGEAVLPGFRCSLESILPEMVASEA
jgi:Uma2 family endonuclease